MGPRDRCGILTRMRSDGNVRIDLTEINRELEDTAPKGRHRR